MSTSSCWRLKAWPHIRSPIALVALSVLFGLATLANLGRILNVKVAENNLQELIEKGNLMEEELIVPQWKGFMAAQEVKFAERRQRLKKACQAKEEP